MVPIATHVECRGSRSSAREAIVCQTGTMPLGRLLITAGLVLVAVGLLVTFIGRLPIKLGRLPGDIYIQGKNSTFYFPLATCLLISVLLSIVMWIFRR
jgi:hypothetical protein